MRNYNAFNPNATEMIEERRRSSLGNPVKVNAKLNREKLATRRRLANTKYNNKMFELVGLVGAVKPA